MQMKGRPSYFPDVVLSPETNLHPGQQPEISNEENMESTSVESTSIQLLDLPHTAGNFSTEQRSETHVQYNEEEECQNQTSSVLPHTDWSRKTRQCPALMRSAADPQQLKITSFLFDKVTKLMKENP